MVVVVGLGHVEAAAESAGKSPLPCCRLAPESSDPTDVSET